MMPQIELIVNVISSSDLLAASTNVHAPESSVFKGGCQSLTLGRHVFKIFSDCQRADLKGKQENNKLNHSKFYSYVNLLIELSYGHILFKNTVQARH